MDENLIEVTEKAVVRLLFQEGEQRIREMEILKIVSETKKTLRLSNGVTVAKVCLFPYHYNATYHKGEEYFFLDKIIF